MKVKLKLKLEILLFFPLETKLFFGLFIEHWYRILRNNVRKSVQTFNNWALFQFKISNHV